MARYFFHYRNAEGHETTDKEGDVFVDDTAAELEAIAAVGELTRNAPLNWQGCCFEVYRENQHLVTVWFEEVLAAGAAAVMRANDNRRV